MWIIERFIEIPGLPLDIPITDIVAAFTPMMTAIWLIHQEEGKTGVRRLFQRAFSVQIRPPVWWLAIVLTPLLIFGLIYLILHAMGVMLPAWHPPLWAIPLLLVFFMLGSAGEELGYMGYAVDPLQTKWTALQTSLWIGIPWAIWHYPSMLQQGREPMWILWGTLGTVAYRVIIVWLYNNTHRNLFGCILIHALYNLGRPLFPQDAALNPLVAYPQVHYGVMAFVAVLIVLFWKPRTLTGNRLKA